MSATRVKSARTAASTNLPRTRPNRSEITATCREIQGEWSPEERARRYVGLKGMTLLHSRLVADVMPVSAKARPTSRSEAISMGRHSRS